MSDSRSDDDQHDPRKGKQTPAEGESVSEPDSESVDTGNMDESGGQADTDTPSPGDDHADTGADAERASTKPGPDEHKPNEHAPDAHEDGPSESTTTEDDSTLPTAHDAQRDPEANASDGTPPPPAPEKERAGGGRGPTLLALLLALLAAAAAGYLGWRLIQLEQRVAAIPVARDDALASMARTSDLDTLQEDFKQRLQQALQKNTQTLNSEREQALGDVRKRLDTLEQGVAGIRELAARDQVSWRLAEIRYLLAVAQRRVAIARDTRSAIAALEAADRSIAELGSVRLLPLRKQIVDDLTALRSVEPADVEGVALRLQNLLGRVSSLPAPGQADDDTAGDDESTPWWQRMTDRLERYVEVRHREAGPARGRPVPATDLPAADELVLALERARSAALGQEPEAYRNALEQARKVLTRGFAGGARVTQRFAAGLEELRQRSVATSLPDLGKTVDLATRLSARIESSRELDSTNETHETNEEG